MPALGELTNAVIETSPLSTTDGNPQSKVHRWINQGYREAVRRSACYVLPVPATLLTPNVGDYTLGSGVFAAVTDVMRFYRLYVGGREVERRSPGEILEARSVGYTGSPGYYALAGFNLLMVDPLPSGSEVVSGLYVPRPVLLVGDADIPSFLPEEFHEMLVEYGLWKAATYDGRPEDGIPNKMEFETGITALQSDLSRFPGGRPRPLRRRGSLRRAWRRDLDTGW